jgi:hypothetical protein
MEVSCPASVTAAVGLPQPTHDGSAVSLERISSKRLERRRGLVDAREPGGWRTLSPPLHCHCRRPTRVGTLCKPQAPWAFGGALEAAGQMEDVAGVGRSTLDD